MADLHPPDACVEIRQADGCTEFWVRRRHPLRTLVAVVPPLLSGLILAVAGPTVTVLLLWSGLEVPQVRPSWLVVLLVMLAGVVLILLGLVLVLRALALLCGDEFARVVPGSLQWGLRWRGTLWKSSSHGLREVRDVASGHGRRQHGVLVLRRGASPQVLGFETLAAEHTRWLAQALREAIERSRDKAS